jgi:hypothetical protein
MVFALGKNWEKEDEILKERRKLEEEFVLWRFYRALLLLGTLASVALLVAGNL